jgi:hypothetical protein
MAPLNTLQTWGESQFNNNVQTIDNLSNFLSAESMVVCTGPPEYNPADDFANLIPVGLVQNVQVSQNKQISQVFEIGSRKPIFIPGRTIVNCGISKILFDSHSLMKALYLQTHSDVIGLGVEDVDGVDVPITLSTGEDAPGLVTDGTTPDFFINLASKFFNRPLGLGFFLRDMEGDQYGGFYLNNCYIQHHTFNIASQQTILVENVSIRCSRLEPVAYGAGSTI